MPTNRKLNEQEESMLLQMCCSYLGINNDTNQQRMQKLLELIPDSNKHQMYHAMKADIVAHLKQQIAQLNAQINMMG